MVDSLRRPHERTIALWNGDVDGADVGRFGGRYSLGKCGWPEREGFTISYDEEEPVGGDEVPDGPGGSVPTGERLPV